MAEVTGQVTLPPVDHFCIRQVHCLLQVLFHLPRACRSLDYGSDSGALGRYNMDVTEFGADGANVTSAFMQC